MIFIIFYQKIRRFEIDDYKKYLNINTAAAKNLKASIDAQTVNSMLSLQSIQGIGEKAMQNIHDFIKSKKKVEIIKQSNLF